MIERILLPGILEPVSHYCHVVRAGHLVWVSGAVGMDADGKVPESVVEQFDLAIGVMDQCLRAAGTSNPRRIDYFGDNRPASKLVEVSALVDPRLKVEIECQAYLPDRTG
jgi:enamine deaminase RidA (YjgF/YER057c/UK114 family)